MCSDRLNLLDHLLHPPSVFESAVAYGVFVDTPKRLHPRPRTSAVLSWGAGALGPSVNAGALSEVTESLSTLGCGPSCWCAEFQSCG